MKIAVISGGFDPIHSGHITYINEAAKHGERLFILLNSDNWLINKKQRFFMPFAERKVILESISLVNEVFDFEDDDLGSCIKGLRRIKDIYPKDELIFCNGGDRNKSNIPEMSLNDIEFKFGVGGNKKRNSSSWILKNWQYPHQERVWGKFYDLFLDENVKVKELIVNSHEGMSFQKHFKRNELWLVTKGSCKVLHSIGKPEEASEEVLKKHNSFFVKEGEWHQIINPNNYPCHIIEIQYGTETSEEDIERLYHYRERV